LRLSTGEEVLNTVVPVEGIGRVEPNEIMDGVDKLT